MNDRQAQLVAAGELMRRWVHTQRASWSSSDGRLGTAGDRMAAASTSPRFESLTPSMASAVAPAAEAATPTSAAISRAEASISDLPGAFDEHQVAREAWSSRISRAFAAPAHWRAAVAAACLAAAAVATPVYWGTWAGVLKGPVGAGQHALARGRRTLATQVRSKAAAPVEAADHPTPASGVGTLHVESEPAGAEVLVDGKARGATPVDVTGLAPGTHTVRLKTDTGVIDRVVRVAAGETTEVSEAIYSGWLHVSAPFEIDVAEGTRSFTLDDSSQALMSPGSHEITFANRALGFRDVRRINIRPGGTTSVVLVPPPALLSVTASEPAEVMVDGDAVGATPLVDLPTSIGTRDLTVTSASGAVRRLTITLTTQPARVEVDFTRP